MRGGRIFLLDSTLRDGAQAQGVSFSVADKLQIAMLLDQLGLDYIEAGNPGSNPKDAEFFSVLAAHSGHAALKEKLVAFGMTCRKGQPAEGDRNLQALLNAGTQTVSMVGKCSRFQVTEVLDTTGDENLRMIADSVAFLKRHNRTVIFDAEHFFDGYKQERAYALDCLRAAGGADWLVLCDTNGGAFPDEIKTAVADAAAFLPNRVGIHCHNDCGLAVANSMAAVESGATQVQGTVTGFGERCGNANLSTLIPNLQIKRSYHCVPADRLARLTSVARSVTEISNLSPDERAPYVGLSAFAHKGGMHVDAVQKHPQSFEHIDPARVGNERKCLTSEAAGRSTVLAAIRRVDPAVMRDAPETGRVIERLKELEYGGYQFEAAEGSFELRVRKWLGKYRPTFELVSFKTIGEQPRRDGISASAVIKVIVDGKTEITAAEGNGPVNALDKALRKALEVFYPQLANVHLTDYKVRVLDGSSATASKVRVLIESSDGQERWTTVGVSNDILEASWIALVDSIEYKLIREMGNG